MWGAPGSSIMHKFWFFAVASGIAVMSGCASSATIPAHTLEAVVVYDGVTTRAILAFPERDLELSHSAGDASCSFSKGNCGSDSPTEARVDVEGSAPSPLASGRYTTLQTGDAGIYDVALTRTDDDEAAYQSSVKQRGAAAPAMKTILCRVYESELGTEQRCYYSMKTVSITLTRR